MKFYLVLIGLVGTYLVVLLYKHFYLDFTLYLNIWMFGVTEKTDNVDNRVCILFNDMEQ